MVTGLMAPALIGVLILVGLIIFWRRYHFAFDDMIVLVDDDNNPIGTARKIGAHDSQTHLHRAFSVFVFNRRGELLLQQRSLGKKTWPGIWSNSCCGHVMLHESIESAAKRRLNHELGLRGIEVTLALPDFRYRAEKDGVVENELCPVLVGVSDDEPSLNAAEVASIQWVAWNEFLDSIEKADTDISPWAVTEARLLAESDAFKEWFAREVAVSKTGLAAVC
jgi:isopentenyl-diphosphate delta-isomerase